MTTKTALWDFPKLGNVSKEESLFATKLKLRAFGSAAEDLEINFGENSPNLVTQIIRLCSVVANDVQPLEQFYWSLEVGKRIECLVRIANSENSSDLVTILKCLKDGCGKYLELSISLNDLLEGTCKNSDYHSCNVTISGKNIILRKPTGFDQLSWLSLDHVDHMGALKSILATLLDKNTDLPEDEIKSLSDDVIQQIGEALSKIDPLIDYKIELDCPICRTNNLYKLDLEKLLLKKLREIQTELLSTIHQLATNYHWTEKEILSIPSSRRRLYVSFIEGEYQ